MFPGWGSSLDSSRATYRSCGFASNPSELRGSHSKVEGWDSTCEIKLSSEFTISSAGVFGQGATHGCL